MKERTLDPLTLRTFQWIKGRMTAAERARLRAGRNGPTEHICEKESDKGRIRRLKVKVQRVMSRPRAEWQKFLSPAWIELFDQVKDLEEN